jgi:hypothetical protein
MEPTATKVVWITLLAMCNRDGVIEAAIPSLAKTAGVSMDECTTALETFLAPDPYSRSKEHEGRRIEAVDGGWRLLNYFKYRAKMNPEEVKEKAAQRQQRHRDKKKAEYEALKNSPKTKLSYDKIVSDLKESGAQNTKESASVLRNIHQTPAIEDRPIESNPKTIERVKRKVMKAEQIEEEVRVK